MSRAVIAFGANLGDREATIASATRAVAEADGVVLVAVSPVYETAAVRLDGVDPEAPRYLNGVIVVETDLEPHAILDLLQRVEAEHGRTRETRWGDRTLDLDLIDVRGVRLAETRPGSGLGLAITKAIAEAHGGTLSVQSEPGRGSTFTIVLPV